MKPVPENEEYLACYKVPKKRVRDFIMRSLQYEVNIAEGSVRSSKTTAILDAFKINLDKTPHKLHLAMATNAGLAQVLFFENDGFGLMYNPEWAGRIKQGLYKGFSALYITTNDGREKVVVAIGGETSVSYKTFRGMTLGSVIASEINLLHIETLKEIKKRTLGRSYRRLFFDLNPTAPSHIVYKWLEEFPIRNEIHMTLEDNPIYTPQQIQEIAAEFPKGSIEYKRYILGLRVAGEGKIYTVSDHNIIRDRIDPNKYCRFMISGDTGMESSGTAFLLMALTNDLKEVHILWEYFHRNKGLFANEKKMPQDYVIEMYDFIKMSEEIMGFPAWRIISDPADLTFHREFYRNRVAFNVIHNLLGSYKEPVEVRIKTGVNLLYTGRLKIHQTCAHTIQQLEEAVWDEAKAEKGEWARLDNPNLDITVDCLDALEYGITEMSQYLFNNATGEAIRYKRSEDGTYDGSG